MYIVYIKPHLENTDQQSYDVKTTFWEVYPIGCKPLASQQTICSWVPFLHDVFLSSIAELLGPLDEGMAGTWEGDAYGMLTYLVWKSSLNII